jgi:hypothetical protein
VTVTAFGPDGAQVGSTQILLAAHAKSSNTLKGYPGMAIAGKQGRVVVSVPNGAVSVLAPRFGGSAFTDSPINYSDRHTSPVPGISSHRPLRIN